MRRFILCVWLVLVACMVRQCLGEFDEKTCGYHGPMPQNSSYFDETVQKQLLLYNKLIDLEWLIGQRVAYDTGTRDEMPDLPYVVSLIDRCRQLHEELDDYVPIDWDGVRNLLLPKRQDTLSCEPANMLREINQESKDILSYIATIRAQIGTFNECVNRCTKLVGATAPVPTDGHLYVLPNGLTITQPGLYCLREFVDASGLAAGKPTIILQSEDITFDMRDNALISGSAYTSTERHGIWVQRSNVTVRGGTITGTLGSDTPPFNSALRIEHESGERLSNIYVEGMTLSPAPTAVLRGNGSGLAMHRVDDSRVVRVRGIKAGNRTVGTTAAIYLRGCNNVLVEHCSAQQMEGTGFLINDDDGETSSGLVFRDNVALTCGYWDGSTGYNGGFKIDNASGADNIGVLLMGNTVLGNIRFGFQCTNLTPSAKVQFVNNFARSSRGIGGPRPGYLNYENMHPDYAEKKLDDTSQSFPFGSNIGE